MTVELVRVAAHIERDWATIGLRGSLLARHLSTGLEVSIDPAQRWVLASVAKLPLAAVVFDAFEQGLLDPAELIHLHPGSTTRGPTGTGLFVHPSAIAAEDLVTLMLSVSDSGAADALLDVLGMDHVNRRLAELGHPNLSLRHPQRALYGAAALGGVNRGLTLAAAHTPGGGHLLPELDLGRANVATPDAMVTLLQDVWRDGFSSPAVSARIRDSLTHQLVRHRLAAELASDAVDIRSKTGTFLDLRHEVGVIDTGHHQIAIAIFTRSQVPAREHLETDLAIGHAARIAVDALLDHTP